jgi:hypothetical protein
MDKPAARLDELVTDVGQQRSVEEPGAVDQIARRGQQLQAGLAGDVEAPEVTAGISAGADSALREVARPDKLLFEVVNADNVPAAPRAKKDTVPPGAAANVQRRKRLLASIAEEAALEPGQQFFQAWRRAPEPGGVGAPRGTQRTSEYSGKHARFWHQHKAQLVP